MLKLRLNFKNIIYNLLLTSVLFIIVSLFLSYNKLYIVLIVSFIFLFFKESLKKIIILNLFFLIILLKLIFTFYSPDDYYSVLSKTIYEKHFLVGVKNLNLNTSIFGGNMDPNNKKSLRNIKIKTDNLGFRNTISPDEASYILVGDSLFHNHRIDQNNLINEQLNKKNNYNFYNASITGADMGHYFETIKYFKENYNGKKFIMIIFPGNDFLSYKTTQNKHSKKLENNFLKNYFEIKEFFDLHTRIKFIISFLKKEKLSNRIDRDNYIGDKNVYFYKRYYVNPDAEINFSKKFDIYLKYSPDILIIVPSKAQVYCKYLENFNCVNIDYVKQLEKISLFSQTKIIDSTEFLRVQAENMLNENKLIYFEDDTHLNELGLNVFSNFILDNLN
tara:strand:- start:1736 stop:2902 length:1167 start_codon:yes stop_codon:yes gene_type:complete